MRLRWISPISRIFTILLVPLAVILFGMIVYRVPQWKAETAQMKALRGSMESQAAMLEQEAEAVKARTLEKILTENFTAQELAEIGRKYFTYELYVNGKKINPSNVQMNVTDSCLEIVINEFVEPGGFPARILKECSIFYPDRKNRTGDDASDFPAVTVHATSSPFTGEIRYLLDRTVSSFSFPRIEVGEIITIMMNDSDLVRGLGLDRNRIEITHSYE